MSYISRDGILKDLQEELEVDSIYYNDDVNKGITEGLKLAIKNIKRFPTADVVEVVRCKDCLFAKKGFDECDIYCKLNDASFGKDAYCSYGERRENGT